LQLTTHFYVIKTDLKKKTAQKIKIKSPIIYILAFWLEAKWKLKWK